MEKIKDILEILYFASGPIIAIAASIGLYQLIITKRNAIISSKRDAYRLAAEQCRFYNEKIIPLVDALDEQIEKKSIAMFEKSKVTIKAESFEVKFHIAPDDKPKVISILPEIVYVLNAMESFSMFFTSGLADEKIAYSVIGKTFRSTVKKFLPFLELTFNPSEDFKPMLELFFLWNNRAQHEALLKDKKTIEERLGNIDNNSINPVGTA